MNRVFLKSLLFLAIVGSPSVCLAHGDDVAKANDSKSAALKNQSFDTAKLQPPVKVEYKILGTPAVGEPLEIEITVSSDVVDMPIQVDYRATDRDTLRFMPENGEVQSFKLANTNLPGTRKIVVVPQREGRNRFVVTTQLQMPDGVMANSRAITVQVGNAPIEKQINGELKQDENGETVISMPAD